MTGNDGMNGASKDISLERVRELLEDVQRMRAEFEASMAAFHASQVGIRVSMSEEQYRLQQLMYSAEHRLSHAALELAEAYLGSATQLEALTLERDRLAHELRLLREAVGGEVTELREEVTVPREALQEFLRLAKMGSSYAALKAASEPIEAALAQPLSSDTPERSGGEG